MLLTSGWCIAKKKKEEEKSKRDANDRGIAKYFEGAAQVKEKPKVCVLLGMMEDGKGGLRLTGNRRSKRRRTTSS